MKKTIIGLLVLTILLASSCSKNNTSSANSWTFNGTTYRTTSTADPGGGYWNIASANPNGTIQVNFSGSSLPTTPGTYTVLAHGSNLSGSNKLTIYLEADDGSIFHSTGAGTNTTVNISVASNGKVTMTGSGIELSNAAFPTDLGLATFNITEL